MRLKRFKVKNYRSINSAPSINVATNLTIIGPNNEGKSNLVRALVTGLGLLEEHAEAPRRFGAARTSSFARSRLYEWARDFPIGQQDAGDGRTEFKLEFDLDPDDQNEFYENINSYINNHLPMTIRIGRNSMPEFEVNKPGKGYAALTAKSSEIAAFIGNKLSINYIEAVRTARHSASSVERLVASALRRVERTDEYRAALQTIEDLRRPVLEELEVKLKSSLKTFVPAIRDVSLQLGRTRSNLGQSVQIGIDDGRLTPLSNKGDGIISLVGMALLSRIDDLATQGINLILVIEEPESHLHPRAIHSVRNILDELGGEVQVIITTHSPALVNRMNVGENVIVENSKARVADSISEIRDVLGVRVSDNLTNSRLSIICEGENDSASLTRLLCDVQPDLESSFANGEVSFTCLGGGGNLSYSASAIQNSICEPVCFLDDDPAGHQAFDSAVSDGLLTDEDCVFTSRLGKDESEFEDLISDELVAEYLNDRHKVDLGSVPNGFRKKKFSVRVRAAFEKAGRPWNERVKSQVKRDLNSVCATKGIVAIDADRRGPIVALAALAAERLRAD